MADNSRRKIAIIAISSTLLVVIVVGAIVLGLRKSESDKDKENQQRVSTSSKTIKSICNSTDYKDTCYKSLNSAAANSTDPKQLIQTAFQVTIKHIEDAVKNFPVLQELQQDPRTILALENCRELAYRAADDLKRSLDHFHSFDLMTNLVEVINDLKIWLSGAITYQETCLDGFEDAPAGDASQKVRNALNTSMELTSNCLAMITHIASAITSFDFGSPKNRRLLSVNPPVVGTRDDLEFHNWHEDIVRELADVTPNNIKTDLVVAKDGSGKYKTINEALNDIPTKSKKRFVVYIKTGVYEEKVTFNRNQTYVMIIGDGPANTRITGKLNFMDKTPTYHTATVVVKGDFFIAKDVGFENSAGPEKHQAVALRVSADKAVFYNCHMDGHQDTLYAHTYRQFYRNCRVTGTIDFVFGDSATILQNCTLVVRKPQENQRNIVTAQGRKDVRQPTGLVLQNCSIVADPSYYPFRNQLKTYLGRPWKQYSRTIIMESFIDDLIPPEGWVDWNGTFALDTLFYTEFDNRGPGAPKTQRRKWPGIKELPASRIQRFTAKSFIDADTWVPDSGVPYEPGYIFPLPKEDPSTQYSPISPEETADLSRPKEKSSYRASPPGKGKKNSPDDDDEEEENGKSGQAEGKKKASKS